MYSLFLGTAAILFIIQLQCYAYTDDACVDGWIKLKRTCFKFVTDPKHYTVAISYCHQIGSELTNASEIQDNADLRYHWAMSHSEIDKLWVVDDAGTASRKGITAPRTKVVPAAAGIIVSFWTMGSSTTYQFTPSPPGPHSTTLNRTNASMSTNR
ncbi:hypothetical protein Btru_058736 [Bulinus truncatus]|nr:hypothetical protein Btru_058736 [Bulinus truncatus]